MRCAWRLVLLAVLAVTVGCRTAPRSALPVAVNETASPDEASTAAHAAENSDDQESSAPLDLVSHEQALDVEPEPQVADEPAQFPVAPQVPDDPRSGVPGEFTLSELEAMAACHNPSIQQASAVAHAARGVRDQVGLRPNPTVGYAAEEIGSEGTAGLQGAYVSQTVVFGHKLEHNVVVAQEEVQARLWQVEAQRFRVRNDVRTQFFETLGAQRRIELTHDLQQLAEAGVETAKILESALQGSRADVLQAEIQLNEVIVLKENAVAVYEARRQALAALVGCPELLLDRLAGTLEDEHNQRDYHQTLQELLSDNPVLQQAMAEVRRARAGIAREEVQPIPNLQANLGVMHDNTNGDDVAMVTLGLPLPIFNDNRGNIDRAAANYHRACANLDRLRLDLRSRLADAYAVYEQASNRVRIYREQILPRKRRVSNSSSRPIPNSSISCGCCRHVRASSRRSCDTSMR